MKILGRMVLLGALLVPCFSWSAEPAPRDAYASAVSAYLAKDYALAQSIFTQLIDAGSDDPRVFYYRGLTNKSQGKADAAKADYETAASLEVTGRNGYDIDRVLEKVQGSERVVIEQHRRAAKQAHAKSLGGYRRTKALQQDLAHALKDYEAGRYTEAKRAFDALATELRTDPRVFYFRGLAQYALKDEAAAQADFEHGVKLETSSGNRVDMDQALLKVQGPAREYLESHRRDAVAIVKLQQRQRERELTAQLMANRASADAALAMQRQKLVADREAAAENPAPAAPPKPKAVAKATPPKPKADEPPSPPPMPPAAPAQSGINFAYLPAETEGLVHVRVKDLWNAPLLMPLKLLPQVNQNMNTMKDKVGFTIKDVETVTLATIDVQSGIANAAPNPGAPMMPPPFIVVVRTSVDLDATKLENDPELEKQEDNGKSYFKAKQGDFAVFIAEARAYVGGSEELVKAALQMESTAEPLPNFAYVDATKQIVIAGSPKDLEGLKAMIPDELGSGIPALDELAKAVKENDPKGAAIGIGVSKGIDIEIRAAFGTTEQADTVNKALAGTVEFGKQSFEFAKPTLPPPVVGLASKIVSTLKTVTQNESAMVTVTITEAAIQEAILAAPAMLQFLPPGLPIPGLPGPMPQ